MQKISEIMTRDVDVVRPDASLEEAARKMRTRDVGPLPVCDGDRVVGLITDRDIVVRATARGCDPKSTMVREAMTPDPVCIRDDDDIDAAMRLMEDRQIRRLPVVDRAGKLVGILALGDIAVDGATKKEAGKVLREVSEPAQPKR